MAGGLFDSGMFNSGTYSGDGGWLSALLQHPEIQAAMQQGGGLPQPQQAPALPPPTTVGAPPPIAGPAALPQNSSPIMMQMPSQAAPQAPQGPQTQQAQDNGPGLGDRLMAGFQGFVNSGSPLGAIGNLVGGLATGQRSDPMGMRMQNQQATYQALLASGVPAPAARAAAVNPEVLKVLAPEYFGGYKVVQTGEDPLGKKYMVQGPGGTFKPIPDSAGGAGVGANMSLLAPGVRQLDPNATGDAYLAQFGPEVQAAVKSYINGDVMPTGNPRQQGIANFAKTVAQKYGMDTGVPVSDATYSAKRRMQADIGASSNGTMGGIISNGKSAFQHLGELSDKLVTLGNSNGINFPGGALAAEAGNYLGNGAFGTAATRDKLGGVNDAALKYGQESTKFYAGSGGGEGERLAALKTLNPQTATAAQQAGFLETEKQLMTDRLAQKEAQIRDVMGQGYLDQHPVVTPELRATISKIDANIAKLRSGAAGEGAAAPAMPRVASPADAAKLPRGTQFIDPNGQVRVVP